MVGVYFDNKPLDDLIVSKFNLGDSMALYSSADKGVSILKCRAPTSAYLKEDIWDATKGNATYFEAFKQASTKACTPAQDFSEL